LTFAAIEPFNLNCNPHLAVKRRKKQLGIREREKIIATASRGKIGKGASTCADSRKYANTFVLWIKKHPQYQN
jgi:hypothetical protein